MVSLFIKTKSTNNCRHQLTNVILSSNTAESAFSCCLMNRNGPPRQEQLKQHSNLYWRPSMASVGLRPASSNWSRRTSQTRKTKQHNNLYRRPSMASVGLRPASSNWSRRTSLTGNTKQHSNLYWRPSMASVGLRLASSNWSRRTSQTGRT